MLFTVPGSMRSNSNTARISLQYAPNTRPQMFVFDLRGVKLGPTHKTPTLRRIRCPLQKELKTFRQERFFIGIEGLFGAGGLMWGAKNSCRYSLPSKKFCALPQTTWTEGISFEMTLKKSQENILVVGPAWVGDMVMAQSLFMCLKGRYPDCRISVLAPDWTRPLL